jgi:hypothetical protein
MVMAFIVHEQLRLTVGPGYLQEFSFGRGEAGGDNLYAPKLMFGDQW